MNATSRRVLLGLLATGAFVPVGRGAAQESRPETPPPHPADPYVLVLGVAQDGGVPQAGDPDHPGWEDPERRRLVVSIAVVDPATSGRWLFEATPDFPEQLHRLDRAVPVDRHAPGLDGIFLTHAHVGHYAGLLHLGREVIGASGVPVYAMPRMGAYLRTNGPWDQLVRLGNVEIRPLEDGVPVRLGERIAVTPFRVPHRDEYSETVGFRIEGPSRTVVFLPDIDSWEAWDAEGTRIEDVVADADVAFLDATFYAEGELPGRDMSTVPHPLVVDTMERLAGLSRDDRAGVRFIHLNRTNPAIRPDSEARRAIEAAGFRVAEEGERIGL